MKENGMEEMTEVVGPIVATEAVASDLVVAELDRRVRELEAAIGDLRSVGASATYAGRKTQVAVIAKSAESQAASVDEALRSLSVEQRIAVKSGLMRAGLLA